MTDEQQNFLLLSENEHGWGCRWDWVLKHLAANISRKGVQCFTRTRILSCSKENKEYILELSSTERHLPTHLTADRVIVMSPPKLLDQVVDNIVLNHPTRTISETVVLIGRVAPC